MTDIPKRTAEAIERRGFYRLTLVAFMANMAAATIHSGQQLKWPKIRSEALEGTKEAWEALEQEDKRSHG